MRPTLCLTLVLMLPLPALAQPDLSLDSLDGTQPLVMEEPLDVVMVRGINYFAEREIADSPNRRAAKWNRDYGSPEAYQQSIEPNRQRLREIIGAVDERVGPTLFWGWDSEFSDVIPPHEDLEEHIAAHPCRWSVMDGVTGEGITLRDFNRDAKGDFNRLCAFVVVIPDASQTPEDLCGLSDALSDEAQAARRLAQHGCDVHLPALISRDFAFSGHPDVRFTNQPHREFIYRMAFEMGRHVIGYEVQKTLELIDHLINSRADLIEPDIPIVVVGIGEGGLIAMYATALDPRIDICVVSGYFQEREAVWREPIYRNIWDQLTQFGDADIAGMIAPRQLIIEACRIPEITGPPAVTDGRSGGAAPGRITTPDVHSVEREFERARSHYEKLNAAESIELVVSDAPHPCGDELLKSLLKRCGVETLRPAKPLKFDAGDPDYVEKRQQRQVAELNRFTQRLMHSSDKYRDKVWAKVDRTNLETATNSLDEYRDWVYDTLIGRLPAPTMPLNPRTRKVIDEPTHVGYEVVLDLFPPGDSERPMPTVPDAGSVRDSAAPPLAVDDNFFAVGEDWGVIAGGILLIPSDLQPGERRPVVVCQHGLEGTPMSTIITDRSDNNWNYYKGFATELCKRGFITYAPQNPYRGGDAFRHIQRKSNPMGRSLFSYIIPQHKRTLEFLGSLPYVDPERIGFYGLSYGGKTAVRVPPLLPPTGSHPGYALSICSADFDEWVRKNASSEDKYSYVFYGEYEIFEWNMGHVANYAELSYLMTPRPFMVERGHDDGVAPDEWVAWEYAKVKRHYDKLGIGERTEMEVFNGPHSINGEGTYDFLHRHLNWPAPGEQ